MKISQAFPSQYLRAADLGGKAAKATISHVIMEDIGSDNKPVLYFQGKEKGLVLNKTNSGNIAYAYGDDTEDWQGSVVELFEAMVDFQGKTVPAIRVRIPRNPPAQRAAQQPPQHQQEQAPPMDDDVPF